MTTKNHKIVSIMAFMRMVCIIVFYVHFYFLKLFFSMKRDYGNDDFIRIVTFSVKMYYKSIF